MIIGGRKLQNFRSYRAWEKSPPILIYEVEMLLNI